MISNLKKGTLGKMHLVEKLATKTGLKISKPSIRETYIPVEAEQYITIDIEKENSRLKFSCFQEIINFIHPILEQENIKILQVGGADQGSLKLVQSLQGKINISQTAYVIKNSLAHICSDSTSGLLANIYGVSFCCLIPSKDDTYHFPYWDNGKGSEVIVSEEQEMIKPERVSRIVLGTLGLADKYNFNPPFETIYVGDKFLDGVEFVESLPNQSVDLKSMGAENIMFRMDLLHDEKKLIEQLTLGKAIIITKKPIDAGILKTYKENIAQLVYIVEEDNDPDFAIKAKELGLNLYLFSKLPKERLNPKKIDYIDIDVIHEAKDYTKEREEILSHGIKNVYFKSNKYTLSNSKVYPSELSYSKDTPISSKGEILPIEDSPLFWDSLENFIIFKKLD